MSQNERAEYLNYLVKQYDGITRLIAQTKQRLLSLPGDRVADYDDLLKGVNAEAGLETVKRRISRDIKNELKLWPVWSEWLSRVPGIGPGIAGKLIVLYYYKFTPICKDCGGILEKSDGTLVCSECEHQAKDGVLSYQVVRRDFPTISKWWAFMGRHTIDGVMPRRKAGVISNWSSPGRALGFHIGDQFNRQKSEHPYKAFLIDRKRKHEGKHPDWSKGHRHNAAKNEAVKLFLSHFWVVARELDGLPVSDPYSGVIMGHTNIIRPFYWDCEPVSK
mgnify:CR=1 FL=1